MKKIILLLTLFIFSLTLAGCIKQNAAGKETAGPQPPTGPERPEKEGSSASLSLSKQGISATVENVRRENGRTILELSLSNHQYDLSAMDVRSLSSLNGVAPDDFKVISSATGGHHVEAELIFGGELYGPLVVGLKEDLAFEFNLSR